MSPTGSYRERARRAGGFAGKGGGGGERDGVSGSARSSGGRKGGVWSSGNGVSFGREDGSEGFEGLSVLVPKTPVDGNAVRGLR